MTNEPLLHTRLVENHTLRAQSWGSSTHILRSGVVATPPRRSDGKRDGKRFRLQTYLLQL